MDSFSILTISAITIGTVLLCGVLILSLRLTPGKRSSLKLKIGPARYRLVDLEIDQL